MHHSHYQVKRLLSKFKKTPIVKFRRKSDGTYIEARGTVQHYKFGQVFETLEARNKLEGKVYFKVKSL
ncbi:hypothetical protein, partial [Pseudoalteromonas luteoviolacea]|uniref:hypothetical protein n=1 Tax=Pseudoalteromonas luteoviolacea TaxID=43657 RepID=UPI001C3FFCCF